MCRLEAEGLQGPPGGGCGRGSQRQLPPRIGSLVRKPGAFAYRFREHCFPPCTSASPTTRCGSGAVSVPTWSTCGSCTWRRPPGKPGLLQSQLRQGVWDGRAQGARSSAAQSVRQPEDLRPPAYGQPTAAKVAHEHERDATHLRSIVGCPPWAPSRWPKISPPLDSDALHPPPRPKPGAATDASTGSRGSPGCPRARPGKSSKGTA